MISVYSIYCKCACRINKVLAVNMRSRIHICKNKLNIDSVLKVKNAVNDKSEIVLKEWWWIAIYTN